jgi:uncharacterized protein YbjT (DUF2867 family)
MTEQDNATVNLLEGKQEKFETTIIDANNDDSTLRVLVTGASGFIGSRLVSRLTSSSIIPSISNPHFLSGHQHNDGENNKPTAKGRRQIICMTRDTKLLEDKIDNIKEKVEIVEADVMIYQQLVEALYGIDVAFYLIHSMEGSSSKEWKKFAEKDRKAAENFARAATECGVKRIIYLGGLVQDQDTQYQDLSEHMRSRIEVGKILKISSSSKVTIFRAAVILGHGGGSFQMLKYLVERLPIMVCPKWVLTKSQPIAVDDVVTYLVKAMESKDTEDKTLDIGGPDILTYVNMMKRYAKIINKRPLKILIIPFLTPRLSSYWVDLVTPVKASLARPLIDSLKYEAIVKDDSIKKIIPLKLKTFEEAIIAAKQEEEEERIAEQPKITKTDQIERKERTSHWLNNKILIVSLFLMAAVGSTYYIFNTRPEIFGFRLLALGTLWYLAIVIALYFVSKGARLGAMISGVVGWVSLAFWIIDSLYTFMGQSVISTTTNPNYLMTVRNIVGPIIAAMVVAASHNVFHKISIHSL